MSGQGSSHGRAIPPASPIRRRRRVPPSPRVLTRQSGLTRRCRTAILGGPCPCISRSSLFDKRTPSRRSLSTVHANVGGFFVTGFVEGKLVAHRVGIIGGDGIGPEVVGEALKVVRAAGVELDTVDYDLGGRRYLETGEVLPDAILEEIRGLDAILLGAVGTPEGPPGVLDRGLLLRMRF